jgi:hypothetical protein
MADELPNVANGQPLHRGRIQAQNDGTEKSVSWAKSEAPTVSEMLKMVDDLEAKLTARERQERASGLEKLRAYIRSAGRKGGAPAGVSKSWGKPGQRSIRIDLEVKKGLACVPDPPDQSPEE